MKGANVAGSALALALALASTSGCSQKTEDAADGESAAEHAQHEHGHEHHAPHGGTAVVLGDEAYHLELVLDADAGTLMAFVLDAEMENFIRVAAPAFDVTATAGRDTRVLNFRAVGDAATGERVGDTSMFEASAEWLKTTREFDGVIEALTIRGSEFADVAFNFPRGNEQAGEH